LFEEEEELFMRNMYIMIRLYNALMTIVGFKADKKYTRQRRYKEECRNGTQSRKTQIKKVKRKAKLSP
jgi:hypothetical protein